MTATAKKKMKTLHYKKLLELQMIQANHSDRKTRITNYTDGLISFEDIENYRTLNFHTEDDSARTKAKLKLAEQWMKDREDNKPLGLADKLKQRIRQLWED